MTCTYCFPPPGIEHRSTCCTQSPLGRTGAALAEKVEVGEVVEVLAVAPSHCRFHIAERVTGRIDVELSDAERVTVLTTFIVTDVTFDGWYVDGEPALTVMGSIVAASTKTPSLDTPEHISPEQAPGESAADALTRLRGDRDMFRTSDGLCQPALEQAKRDLDTARSDRDALAAELAATKRELHRHQCGEQIEGDYACAAALKVQAEKDALAAELAEAMRQRNSFDDECEHFRTLLANSEARNGMLDAKGAALSKDRDALAARVERILAAVNTLWSLTEIKFVPAFATEGEGVMRVLNEELDVRHRGKALRPDAEVKRGEWHAGSLDLPRGWLCAERTWHPVDSVACINCDARRPDSVPPWNRPDAAGGLCSTCGMWARDPNIGDTAGAPHSMNCPKHPKFDTTRRTPGCQCQWEEGDSPCRVHGENEEPTIEDVARMMHAEAVREAGRDGARTVSECVDDIRGWTARTNSGNSIDLWTCAPAIRALIDRERAKRGGK